MYYCNRRVGRRKLIRWALSTEDLRVPFDLISTFELISEQEIRDMATEFSLEAQTASIKQLSKIVGVKERHEQQIAVTVESHNMSALQEAYQLGFDAGVAHAASKKD